MNDEERKELNSLIEYKDICNGTIENILLWQGKTENRLVEIRDAQKELDGIMSESMRGLRKLEKRITALEEFETDMRKQRDGIYEGINNLDDRLKKLEKKGKT